MSRFVLDSAQAAELDSGNTIMTGGKIKTGFINANYIAVDQISSPMFNDDPQSVYSLKGMRINLNAPRFNSDTNQTEYVGTIKAPNFAIDEEGDAYFRGAVTANSGKIAGWNIDGDRLYNNTYILNAAGNTTSTINGVSRSNLVLSIGSNFGVDNTGAIYSSSGNIGGWNIDSDSIYYGTKGSGTGNGDITLMSSNVFSRTINGSDRENLKFAIGANYAIDNTGKMYSSSANVGGWNIDSNSIYYGTKSTGTANSDITLMSSSVFNRTIANTSRTNLKFAIGANFGVDQTGKLYAGSADISGAIKATSLATGGKTAWDTAANGTYIDSSGNIYIGPNNEV